METMRKKSKELIKQIIDNAPSFRHGEEGELFRQAYSHIIPTYTEQGGLYGVIVAAYEYGRATGIGIERQRAKEKAAHPEG